MSSSWVAVDKDGTPFLFDEAEPVKNEVLGIWECGDSDGTCIELPDWTVLVLTGVQMNWNSRPEEIF